MKQKVLVYLLPLLILPLGLLILANLPMQQMPSQGFMTAEGYYINTERLFMLKPPKGWVLTEMFPPELATSAVVSFELREGGGSNPLRLRSKNAGMGMGDKVRANVMVRVWRWDTTVDHVISLMKKPERVIPYEIKSEGPIAWGNAEGYRLHYAWGPFHTFKAGEHEETYMASGGKIYVISNMTFKDIPFNTHLNETKAAIDSFRFLERVTINVENGAAVIDGKRYKKLPTTLYLTKDEPHTIVAEPSKASWKFAGWVDGDGSPSRTVTIRKPESFTSSFLPLAR